MEKETEHSAATAWLWLGEDIVGELAMTTDGGEDFQSAATMLAALDVGVDVDHLCEATGYDRSVVAALVENLRESGRCDGDAFRPAWAGEGEFDEWAFWIDFVTTHNTVDPDTVINLERLAGLWIEDYMRREKERGMKLWFDRCAAAAPPGIAAEVSQELWDEILARRTGKGDKNARTRAFIDEFIRENPGCSFEEAKSAGEEAGRQVSRQLWRTALIRAGVTEEDPVYRHPEDASLTWSGRGRRPAWLNALLDEGIELDTLKVAR